MSVCPVIENSYSKPSSGLVNFQLALNLFLIMGDLFFITDLVVNTLLVAILLGMGSQNSRTVYSMLYLENVKNYDQNFPQDFCF